LRALAINCGSSSLKFALFESDGRSEEEIARGLIERIGEAVVDHGVAVHRMFDDLERRGLAPPSVVGHRIVHGGASNAQPVWVDERLLAYLAELVPFAPLHLPAEIRAVRAVAERWPKLPQVACFDTAFHRSLPEVAQRYAIPESLHAAGLRRYGFHGLSYEYVVETMGAARLGRAVIAHLGSGASMVAVRQGRSVDTTMGFTPAGGLVMGTRAGDLDPGLLVHLVAQGYGATALDEVVNQRGGLLALSGTTADVRELLSRRGRDTHAALALDVFTWSARKWIGAMAATMGGADTLVFTGGIGEHASTIRAEIVQGLEHLGFEIDDERNASAHGLDIVSPEAAPRPVYVVPTDEEKMVARHAARLVFVPDTSRGSP
jgi:acetate kinase